MPIPDRLRVLCVDPQFRLLETDDGSWTLENVSDGDTFHSGCGAREECRHVYLENSGVGDRLRRGQPTRVLEMGLGTATAFVLTAALAKRHAAQLHYTAIEQALLNTGVLKQILLSPQQWPADDVETCLEIASQLISFLDRRNHAIDSHHFQLCASITLQLLETDILKHVRMPDGPFQGIYFDPFSPRSNPQLWQEDFLERITKALAIDGKLVSYCVNSQVRRTFTSLGFVAHRVPGPVGGKREVLVVTHQS